MSASDPNDLVKEIVDALDYYEFTHDPAGLQKARRLVNNELVPSAEWLAEQKLKELGLRWEISQTLSIMSLLK